MVIDTKKLKWKLKNPFKFTNNDKNPKANIKRKNLGNMLLKYLLKFSGDKFLNNNGVEKAVWNIMTPTINPEINICKISIALMLKCIYFKFKIWNYYSLYYTWLFFVVVIISISSFSLETHFSNL